LFIILIADSIISAISIFQRTNFFQIANLIVFIALWGTCVAALIMQRRSRLSAGVKGLAWGSFCYLGLMLLLGYVYSMVVMFNNPAAVRTQWDMTKAIWNASPLDSPVLLAISIFSVASSTSLGIAGLIAWLRMKRMPASPTVQPAETSAGGVQ
jgi:hypothetical protein